MPGLPAILTQKQPSSSPVRPQLQRESGCKLHPSEGHGEHRCQSPPVGIPRGRGEQEQQEGAFVTELLEMQVMGRCFQPCLHEQQHLRAYYQPATSQSLKLVSLLQPAEPTAPATPPSLPGTPLPGPQGSPEQAPPAATLGAEIDGVA